MERFIRHILTPNPYFRPTLTEIIRIIDQWDVKDFKLNEIAEKISTNEKHIAMEEFQKVKKVEWHSMRPGEEWS